MELNFTRLVSNSRFVGPSAPVKAAIILTPGAVISGFRNSGLIPLGPCDEKAAMNGVGLVSNIVVGAEI